MYQWVVKPLFSLAFKINSIVYANTQENVFLCVCFYGLKWVKCMSSWSHCQCQPIYCWLTGWVINLSTSFVALLTFACLWWHSLWSQILDNEEREDGKGLKKIKVCQQKKTIYEFCIRYFNPRLDKVCVCWLLSFWNETVCVLVFILNSNQTSPDDATEGGREGKMYVC